MRLVIVNPYTKSSHAQQAAGRSFYQSHASAVSESSLLIIPSQSGVTLSRSKTPWLRLRVITLIGITLICCPVSQ